MNTCKFGSAPIRVVCFREDIPALGITKGDRLILTGGTGLLCKEIPGEIARALGAADALPAALGDDYPALRVLEGGV